MKFYLLFSTVFIFVSSINALSQAQPITDDVNVWTDATVSFPLIKSTDKSEKKFDRLVFFVSGTLRFGRNVSRPVDERFGFGITYRLNKYVTFTPDYLYRGSQALKGRNDFESRFRFAVTLEKKWKRFSIADRNQVEYRLRNSRQDTVRYKNRLRFNYPIIKDKKELFTLFVADETSYDFRDGVWTKNEFFAGFTKKFNKNFSADFYYLLVKDKSFPKTINGFGVSLKFYIDKETIPAANLPNQK